MGITITVSVAQNLISALESSELRDFLSYMGYETEVEKLQTTMKIVLHKVLPAVSEELINIEVGFEIRHLRDTIYDADDLMDALVTVAGSMDKNRNKGGGKLAKMMRLLLYRLKTSLAASRAKPEMIKAITHKLSTLVDVPNIFHFLTIVRRSVETGDLEDVIGRDGDREKIVSMMLDPVKPIVTQEDGVSFLCIVGIGGLGKTALSKLIFNDERIRNEFPQRLWVCVGDDTPHHLNLKSVLAKVLESADSSKEYDESTPEEDLATQIQQIVVGNKYLLILDNVSCENRRDLLRLRQLLMGGSSGSWVLVTTRSQQTAKVLEDGFFYELDGLSDEDSWSLFQRIAFERVESTTERVESGKEIVKHCANNPHLIRAAGYNLSDELDQSWSSIAKNGLYAIHSSYNIMSNIFDISYSHLDSPLKSCFVYCALFPRDYRINKEMIINLWRAQGFIVPLEESQSIEDAGEEYISILLARYFFKDVERDEYGEVISFKLHPFFHYFVRTIGKNDVCAIDCITNDLREDMLHVSVATHTDTVHSYTKRRVRTLLFLRGDTGRLSVKTLLENWIRLRALDLNNSGIKELPNKIGKLMHLRYLDLSGNQMMKVLPESFTKLKNLETLILRNCKRLRKLPGDLSRLVKLKYLDLKGCDSMTSMPARIGELECLYKLTRFAVDLNDVGCELVLDSLRSLAMINGDIEIRMNGTENLDYLSLTSYRGLLRNKQNLDAIEFCFPSDGNDTNCDKYLMEDMLPNSNLRRLLLRGYRGEVLPRWATGKWVAIFLPNLVEIKIDQCKRLKHLPFFGELPNLRLLSFSDLRNVEYMEENGGISDTSSEIIEVEDSPLFRSLKELWLVRLYKLKGWLVPLFHDDHWSGNTSRPLFPSLCLLVIRDCPKLGLRTGMNEYGEGCSSFYLSQNSSDLIGNSKLLKVTIDSVKCLNSVMWTRSLPCLTELDIEYDNNVEKLEEVGEVLKMSCCLSSLRILRINSCIKLTSIGKGVLQHLTALQKLTVSNCYNLALSCDEGAEVEEDIAVDDPSFLPLPQTLRSLKLHNLPKVVHLPEWMQHLTSLQSLHIEYCKGLKSLPEWMTHLTSLTKLKISSCAENLCVDLESKYVS